MSATKKPRTVPRFTFPKGHNDVVRRAQKREFRHENDGASVVVHAHDSGIGVWLDDQENFVVVNDERRKPNFTICHNMAGQTFAGYWRYGIGTGLPYALTPDGVQIPDLDNPSNATTLTYEQLEALVNLQKQLTKEST